ncbi:MAG: DUF6607 family protein [Wenzhouxiangella sp.]
MSKFRSIFIFAPLTALAALIVSGCAAPAPAPVPASVPAAEAQPVKTMPVPEDRAAILGMVGEFEVSFDFHETVVLAEGYHRRDPHHSGALEVVVVVEDSPERVVLQHILQSPSGHVTKHWRQDWVWEATERFEYSGDQRWLVRELPSEETAGRWTQCVFEVNDAPRYCGTGRWIHRYGVSTWTSDRHWRPLPRRELTTRDDINVLNVRNRHTITPGGWTHEQDNTKAVMENGRLVETLVREVGFNDYRRSEATDFTPAFSFWAATQEFWRVVRDQWQAKFDTGCVHIEGGISGMPMIVAVFEKAAKVAENADAMDQEVVEAIFADHVHSGSACLAQVAMAQ